MIKLKVNGKDVEVDADPQMPLLWVLRDRLGLTGTKFGCGAGDCGACTVHIGKTAERSCITTVGDVHGEITTIEGLSPTGDHPVQKAWRECNVAQCGYCQPGQIMAAAALLAETPNPTDSDIKAGMSNLCRCGTYPRIRQAIAKCAGGAK
jgi:isoquinoline 1-oxidoreductase alpha subunit